jgi:hypothetical protein
MSDKMTDFIYLLLEECITDPTTILGAFTTYEQAEEAMERHVDRHNIRQSEEDYKFQNPYVKTHVGYKNSYNCLWIMQQTTNRLLVE